MGQPMYKAVREAQREKDRIEQSAAVFRDRHGTIDGVMFDLRHKDLDAGNWLPPAFNDFPDRPSNAPFIWFPWYGEFDETALWSEAQKAVARAEALTPIGKFRMSRNRGPTADQSQRFIQTDEEKIRAYVAEHTPECVVFRGDTIEIDHVEIKVVRNAIDHPHDRETREAYLRVRRANNGAVEEICTPISYTGVTSVLDYDIWSYNFEKMAKRIADHFKLESVREMPSVENDGSDAYLALRKAFAVANANKGLDFSSISESVVVVKSREPEEEFHDGSEVRYTINDALMMGYLWAKHELDPHVKAHAESRLQKELEGKAAVRRRVKASRKAATEVKEHWHKVAARVVDDALKENPSLTNDDLLQKMNGNQRRWVTALVALGIGPKIPSPSSLDKFISIYRQRRPSKRSLGQE